MRWPRPSVRLRLTLIYASLFAVAGAALLGVNYLLVQHRVSVSGGTEAILCTGKSGPIVGVNVGGSSDHVSAGPSSAGVAPPGMSCQARVKAAVQFQYQTNTNPTLPPGAEISGVLPNGTTPTNANDFFSRITQVKRTVAATEAHTLHTLIFESIIALGLMALASLGLGWWVAGRVLRPVHRITDAARRLSEETLHDRINLEGPNDELKELADTFDAMLARLDRAFESQRRFVANASHELRTPLATERVLIDEALADADLTHEEMRSILEQLRSNCQDTERLMSGLLMLARSERGVEERSVVDLAAAAAEAVLTVTHEAAGLGITINSELAPAEIRADRGLIERLAGNLLENAVRHNHEGGWVKVSTGFENGSAVVRVSNTGPVIDPHVVPRLVEPFRRAGRDRSYGSYQTTATSFGLGLSIVDAIVCAHSGSLTIAARAEGGLDVRASLPSTFVDANGSTASQLERALVGAPQ